jgi:glycosyltransferase involved in cell wall biosynthesis
VIDGLRAAGQTELTPPHDIAAQAGAAPVSFYHINPQLSQGLADIGRWSMRKISAVFGHVWRALAARFRYDLSVLYFVPGQPKREAIYRDAVVLLLCRPFFSKLVLHWHNIGQPEFIEKLSAPERWLARGCYGRAALSIVLSNYSRNEAAYFQSRRVEVVPNGIPDPCPHFDGELWPERQRRASQRSAVWRNPPPAPAVYRVLFVAGRLREKGLFDAMSAVIHANRRLAAEKRPLRLALTPAGPFEDDNEKANYEAMALELNETNLRGLEPLAVYAGWADEAKKRELYRQCDCLCFPTTYAGESFGLVLIEAMAHGCAIVTTRWQAVPEVLPGGYPNVVDPHDINQMADALLRCAAAAADRSLRDYFVARFKNERFVRDMVRVLESV